MELKIELISTQYELKLIHKNELNSISTQNETKLYKIMAKGHIISQNMRASKFFPEKAYHPKN